jgi:hypothetical protein
MPCRRGVMSDCLADESLPLQRWHLSKEPVRGQTAGRRWIAAVEAAIHRVTALSAEGLSQAPCGSDYFVGTHDLANELLPSVYVVQTAPVRGSTATFLTVEAVRISPAGAMDGPEVLTRVILPGPAQ